MSSLRRYGGYYKQAYHIQLYALSNIVILQYLTHDLASKSLRPFFASTSIGVAYMLDELWFVLCECACVCVSVTTVSPAKRLNRSRGCFRQT